MIKENWVGTDESNKTQTHVFSKYMGPGVQFFFKIYHLPLWDLNNLLEAHKYDRVHLGKLKEI